MYTPEELVRIELLRYPTPDGLHPVEVAWRNLALKLLSHVEQLQTVCVQHHESCNWKYGNNKDCPICKDYPNLVGFVFPKSFLNTYTSTNKENIKIS